MQSTSVTPWNTYFHYIPNNFSSKHSLHFKKTLVTYTHSCHQEQEKHNNNNLEKTTRQKDVYWQEMNFSVEKEKPHYRNDAKEQGVEVIARSGIQSNSWWARIKAALGQRINMEGISFSVGIFCKDKHLAIPHVFVQDIRYIDWAELKKRGFEGVVFDKDNTITVPYSLNLWSPLASSMEQCKSLFGNNIAVFSNSAGLAEYDPDGRKARILERAIGIKVIRHRLKKPAGTAEEIERQFGCKSSRLIMVGDRPLTDIVYGNRNGFLTILTAPLSFSQEPFIVKQMTCYCSQEEIWSLSSNYTYAFKISQQLQDYKQIVERVSFILVVSLRIFRLLSYNIWDKQRESCRLNNWEFLCLAKKSQ